MSFEVKQNNAGNDLLKNLLGNTSGLSNIKIKLTGDGRAFGTFQDDPFGLDSGVVLSTGKVEELPGKNTSDGDFFSDVNIPLKFEKLDGLSGGNNKTAVFRADLSDIGFDINSITVADSGSGKGGGSGPFSGFDLDGIKLSNTRINNAEAINGIPSLDLFDFSPLNTFLVSGTQRPPRNADHPDLFGTINNVINNAVATLEKFDDQSRADVNNSDGSVSLGDNGKIGFDFKETVKQDEPLYLYIGESGNNGETIEGNISVSNRPINGFSDLSTDFGLEGTENDSISMEIEFDADDTAEQLYFQFTFGSEEFAEYAGLLNDKISLKLNGFNLARLRNGSAVTINNISSNPFDKDNPDYNYNPVDQDSVSSETKLDGFKKPLTIVGELLPNAKITLEINVIDARDGLLDSAVFIKGGTLGTVEPPSINTDKGGEGNENLLTPPTEGNNAKSENGDISDTGEGNILTTDNVENADNQTPTTDTNNGGKSDGSISDDANSDESTTLTHTQNNLLFLAGNGSQTQLKFTLTENSADFVNELGVFVADNEQGEINGISPGESGYLQAALEQEKVVFSALSNNQFSDLRVPRQFSLETGKHLGFYLVQNNTTDQVLGDLNSQKTPANVFFANNTANADNLDHLQISQTEDGILNLTWEDIFGDGDADLNDMVVNLEVSSETPKIGNSIKGSFQKEKILIRSVLISTMLI